MKTRLRGKSLQKSSKMGKTSNAGKPILHIKRFPNLSKIRPLNSLEHCGQKQSF